MKLVVNEPTLCRPTDEADLGDRAVGRPQQRRGALEPAGQQVGVRRLAERAPELAAEVRAREAGGAGHVVDAERLEVAGVGEVLGAQQVAGGRDECHRGQYRLDPVPARKSSRRSPDERLPLFPTATPLRPCAANRRPKKESHDPSLDESLARPRPRLLRAVHGRPRRDGRERRAPVDPGRTSGSPRRTSSGSSTPTRSSSAASCCSAAAPPTCSGASGCSSSGSSSSRSPRCSTASPTAPGC